jgi:hypothetical protein
MSDPAIGIGHPVSDPPVPGSCAPHVRPADPAISWCGIRDSPYAIRNSEFGIPESGIGKSGIMVRSSRPIQAVLF